MARVMDRNSEPDLREVLLTKIHTKKTPKMQKDFALSLSIFVFASNDHRLCTVLNAIQPGLVTNVLQHLWSRRAKKTICPWLRG